MPIIDVERVLEGDVTAPPGLAQALAEAAGGVLGSAPGSTWVRLRALPAQAYAENATPASSSTPWPVFVTVLHAHPPVDAALQAQVSALTTAIARVLGCDPQRVHVQMAPAGAGRQAFGGRLVG